MASALQYIWILPVAIGVMGVLYFAMQDLGRHAQKPQAKTED